MVLGRGPARAAAEMAALTLKEAVGMPAEALETAQFRHGPLELAGPNLAAVVIATEPETEPGHVARAGASGGRRRRARDHRAGRGSLRRIGAIGIASVAPAVSLVPIQLLAHRLAIAARP